MNIHVKMPFWCWRWDTGAHFTNDFSITIQIRWKFHLALIQLLMTISQQNFGTCHDSPAVVPCAKYCSDHFISIWMGAKWNFHHIWIVMEKLLVKWAPGPLFTKQYDVLPPNLMKSRSHGIGCYSDYITLKFDSSCQISEQLEKSKPESRGFETSRDLAIRRPSA